MFTLYNVRYCILPCTHAMKDLYLRVYIQPSFLFIQTKKAQNVSAKKPMLI